MFSRMREDVRAVFSKDPAARSTLEVLLCYPGLHAVWFHRVAHWLWNHGMKTPGRVVSHVSRFLTGIEIHPGAKLGRRFFIDHGMGIVIGETVETGEDCLIYQGVVLGGTSLEKKKRHPTLGNGVVVGAGSIVLGPILLGDNCRVGAGSVVIKPVPADGTVVGVPARESGKPLGHGNVLEHAQLPDPVTEFLKGLADEQTKLRERLDRMEGKPPAGPPGPITV
ncbi:MAG: serine O-acetyltransferase [Planctomycetota bacterium]